MVRSVSLIIPFKSDKSEKEKLLTLIRAIPNWKEAPNEIIVINTDQNSYLFQVILNYLLSNAMLIFVFSIKRDSILGTHVTLEFIMHLIHY